MKTKSLFISTIAMVVLLVVALATGTFAWYTAQNQVNATGASVGAVQSNSAAIGLGWTNASATASTIELGTGTVRPMIPEAVLATGTTGPTFEEALLSTDGEGNPYVNSTQSGTPWTQVEWDGSANTTNTDLYIGNLDTTNAVAVTVTVDIAEYVEGTNLNNLLRVAIYYAAANPNEYTYVGTWGAGNCYALDISTTVAGLTSPDVLTPAELIDAAAPVTLIADNIASGVTIPLIGDAVRQIYIYAWLEGTSLNTTNMVFSAAAFNVNFNASQV